MGTLASYRLKVRNRRGGTTLKPWAEISYAIPEAQVSALRSYFAPQAVVSGGAKTASGDEDGTTLTVSGSFFTDTATDAGKAITISGIGTYTIDTVTSPTVAEVTVAFSSTFASKTFSMTGNSVFPGDTGIYARRLMDCDEEFEAPGHPGRVLVTSRYYVPTQRNIVLEDTTKAVVFGDVSGQATRLKYERTGSSRPIEAIAQHSSWDKRPIEWVWTGGAPNQTYEPVARFGIAYAKATLGLNSLVATVGKKNSGALSNLGLGAGTVLCIGVEFEREWDTGSLWFVKSHFLYRPDGWVCSAMARIKVAVFRKPIEYDYATNELSELDDANRERVVEHYWLDGTAVPSGNRISEVTDLDVTLGTSDFSSLDGMTAWDV